jgi:Fe-S cluster assembly iron-binding protein IscA
VSDLTGNRVDIQNPQAQAGCGCGESINFNV